VPRVQVDSVMIESQLFRLIFTFFHSFKMQVIVIMTSNLGAHILSELPAEFLGSEPQVQDSIMEVVRSTLSPELLNRIDETVVFNRLQRDNMARIAEIGIQQIAERLDEGQTMTLDVSQNAKDVISEIGYDVRYGARPLKRTLTRELLNPLSRLVLEGSVREGELVKVRTRAEATKEQNNMGDGFGWISSHTSSENKNDIVIIKNREPRVEEEGTWDDKDFLLEDGMHSHR
jgi:hypothetical protein